MPPRSKAAAARTHAPSTPKKGKKRARSEDNVDEPLLPPPPSKKATISDGTPRRDNGRTYKVPVDTEAGIFLSTHQVYVDGANEVYDVMLNQTNVDGNNNKFYVLQLLHLHGINSEVILYTRWGRVGESGKNQTKGPWDASTGIAEFKKQFKSKTGADFVKRAIMVPKPGKYTWIDKAYDDEDAIPESSSSSPTKKTGKILEPNASQPIPQSELAVEIQSLVAFIFNQDMMKAHLISLNYDVNKQPLGKLGPSTIANGFQALKDLADIISDPAGTRAQDLGGFRKACTDLTSRYYTVIPHVFGRQRPTIIDNDILLKAELDLVGSLGDMELATKIIKDDIGKNAHGHVTNPIDSKLASLDLRDITVVDKSSDEFTGIEMYAKNTNEGMDGITPSSNMRVLEAFRIERNGEEERWSSNGWPEKVREGQRLLLWHGSRTTNFVGILKQGLRIAPPEAPVTGYEFDKGVYFGDMLGISARYTHSHLSGNVGLLLLCEVVAKPYYEAYGFDFQAATTSKNNGKLATKALGKMQHEEWIDVGEKFGRQDLKGVQMPAGHAKDLSSTFPRPSVKVEDIWNEYIVYDVSQIRIRYLLQVHL